MHCTRTASALAAMAALLSGCGSTASPHETQAASTTATDNTAGEYAFGQYVETSGLTKYGSTEQLSALADGICAAFDRGVPWISVLKTSTDSGFTAGDAGGFIAVSVAAYCPTHMSELPAR